MSFVTAAALAADSTFLDKMCIALAEYALSVYGESVGGEGQPTTEEHTARLALAARIIDNPEYMAKRLAVALVADETLTSESSDANLTTQIGTLYNKLAGID